MVLHTEFYLNLIKARVLQCSSLGYNHLKPTNVGTTFIQITVFCCCTEHFKSLFISSPISLQEQHTIDLEYFGAYQSISDALYELSTLNIQNCVEFSIFT